MRSIYLITKSMLSDYRQNILPTMARTSPVVFAIMLLKLCIVQPSFNTFYVFIMYFIVMFSNFLLKYLLFKPLYNLFSTSKIRFLGLGYRPTGASSCQFILDKKLSTSFGMPSGHSQLAWAVSTYILCKLMRSMLNNEYDDKSELIKVRNYIWFCISFIFIISFSLYISYSRVYIEGCHTVQQVIVGALFGIGFGFIIYYFEDSIKKGLNL